MTVRGAGKQAREEEEGGEEGEEQETEKGNTQENEILSSKSHPLENLRLISLIPSL